VAVTVCDYTTVPWFYILVFVAQTDDRIFGHILKCPGGAFGGPGHISGIGFQSHCCYQEM